MQSLYTLLKDVSYHWYQPVLSQYIFINYVMSHVVLKMLHPSKQCKISTVWMSCICQNSSNVGHLEVTCPQEINVHL